MVEVVSSLTSSDGQAAFEARGTIFGLNTQTGAYALVLSDRGKTVEINSATAATLTVPNNATVEFPVGAYLNVVQYGAGQVTIAPGASVTLRSAGGLRSRARYSMITLYKRATNEWIVGGDTTT